MRPRTLRLAIMVTLFLGLLAAPAVTFAAPSFTITPARGAVGERFDVAGSGFAANAAYTFRLQSQDRQLTIANSTTFVRTDANGDFANFFTIATQRPAGTYIAEILTQDTNPTVVAAATFALIDPSASPSPVPSASPSPSPSASPSPSPTPAPSSAPSPSPSASPVPSASPTPAPSASPTPATCAGRFFTETNQCLSGGFLEYWNAHGGLALNGYPLTGERTEKLEDGKQYTVQWFERVRLELHPENPAPNNILLGQFGRLIHPADPPVAAQPGQGFFPQTGHNVPADFFAYWNANGGVAQFGFPLSEVYKEKLEDGKEYEVQYFERARFERHPENTAPNTILLGQFGRRILGSR